MNIQQAREALEVAYPFPQYSICLTVDIDKTEGSKGAWKTEFTVAISHNPRKTSVPPLFHKWGPSLALIVQQAVAARSDTAQMADFARVDVADLNKEETAQ